MTTILSIFFVLLLAIFVLLTKMSYDIAAAKKKSKENEDGDAEEIVEAVVEKISDAKGYVYAGMVVTAVLMLGVFYLLIKGTIYEGHFQEWLNLTVRLLHITFGIAWIGTSFYFVALENGLNRTKGLRDELAGNMWSVHGGGFYYLEKYKIAPKVIPKDLHWFKYEAYFTWLSGFCLLVVVYYFNATGLLIDPSVLDIPAWEAVTVGIGSLIVGYLLYDYLCSTPLLKKPVLFAVIGFVILTGFAWFYTQVFSARAAYIHFGALLGTFMAGNVFFGIIPAQKAMVKAAKEGTYLDPSLGKTAGLRSFHNNYFTLPVLFVMISNHFPSTFGHEYPWVILAVISLGTAGVKHYFNLREKGQQSVWVMPISVLILLSAVFLTAPVVKGGECEEVTFSQIYPIINERCVTCHSASPTDKTWTAPPNGVKYDTPQEIQRMADKIMQRAVITETMPQNNSTGMLPQERELLRCWIEQGARID